MKIIGFLYPDVRVPMTQYSNVIRLRTYGGERALIRILRIKKEILGKSRVKMTLGEKAGPAPKEMADFAQKLALWVIATLKATFPDLLKEI